MCSQEQRIQVSVAGKRLTNYENKFLKQNFKKFDRLEIGYIIPNVEMTRGACKMCIYQQLVNIYRLYRKRRQISTRGGVIFFTFLPPTCRGYCHPHPHLSNALYFIRRCIEAMMNVVSYPRVVSMVLTSFVYVRWRGQSTIEIN